MRNTLSPEPEKPKRCWPCFNVMGAQRVNGCSLTMSGLWGGRALYYVWGNCPFLFCELGCECFCLLSQCAEWISSETSVVSSMFYLCFQRKLGVLEVWSPRLCVTARLLRYPTGSLIKVNWVTSGMKENLLTGFEIGSEQNVLAKFLTAEYFTSCWLDRVSNFNNTW